MVVDDDGVVVTNEKRDVRGFEQYHRAGTAGYRPLEVVLWTNQQDESEHPSPPSLAHFHRCFWNALPSSQTFTPVRWRGGVKPGRVPRPFPRLHAFCFVQPWIPSAWA